jgi:hypothetical protein
VLVVYEENYRKQLKFKRFVPINNINPLNNELNPICHLPALFGAHHILHVSRIRVNEKHVSKQSTRTRVVFLHKSKQLALKRIIFKVY